MMLTLPANAVLVDLSRPDHAVSELATSLDRIRNRPGLAAECEVLAREMVDEVIRGGGYLLAVLADGAVLTGASAPGTPDWDAAHANALRWWLDDMGHETVTMDTRLGPVVVAARRTAETSQLQAFLVEPGTTDLLVVTLTARSPHDWHTHRAAFLDMIHTVN
jgi:hypothetical protein